MATDNAFAGPSKDTLIDFLMDIPIFADLDGGQLRIVADHMTFFEIKKGEILFREGDAGDYVCFVVDGGLDVLKESSQPGKQAVIATIAKKRSIGEMSVIDQTTRSATVKARTDTSLLSLPKKSFDSLLDTHPRIGIPILKGIARMLSMNMRKTSSRLADYMLPDC